MNNSVVIKEILVKNLYDFVLSYNEHKTDEDVDIITPQRALAQSKNPNADEKDVGILLAYKGDWCVGYLGLMPGIMRADGEYKKIIFPTTWFVSPKARGLSISSRLYRRAHELGKLLVCTGMSDIAEKIYQHMGFKPMKPVHFYSIDFTRPQPRLNRKIKSLINKLRLGGKSDLKKNKSISNVRYISKNYKKILREYSAELSEIGTREINKLEEIGPSAGNKGTVYFHRGKEVINWMLKYKWVLGTDEGGDAGIDYAFSNTHDRFLYKAFSIKSVLKSEESGFIIISITQDRSFVKIKLLDHHIQAPLNNEHILAFLFSLAENELTDKIEIPEIFGNAIRPEIIRKNIKKEERRYLFSIEDWSDPLVKFAEKAETDYCDGDIAFT